MKLGPQQESVEFFLDGIDDESEDHGVVKISYAGDEIWNQIEGI